jgi:hypothetical protein
VLDVSDRQRVRDLRPVRVALLDDRAATLAEAQSIEPGGAIVLTAPAPYGCHDVETRAPFSTEARQEWDVCFARQSRWVPTWIGRVHSATVSFGSCALERLPVKVSAYPDTWWLWWVPLRHIGGKPYTSYSIAIAVEAPTRCGAAISAGVR